MRAVTNNHNKIYLGIWRFWRNKPGIIITGYNDAGDRCGWRNFCETLVPKSQRCWRFDVGGNFRMLVTSLPLWENIRDLSSTFSNISSAISDTRIFVNKIVHCADSWSKGLILGINSIAIVLLGWISLYKDFESGDLNLKIFQGYIGLTIFEAVVKVSQNYAKELDRIFFQTIIRIGFWAKILGRRCSCLIFFFIAGFLIELFTDLVIGHTGYKYAFDDFFDEDD